MTPQQYYQKKVSEDSSLYYSLRFLPTTQRKTLTALNVFYSEVSEIRYQCHDISVAQAKFQWWQDEITQTFKGTPHHPVCQALRESIRHHHLEEHYFQELIEGLLLDLNVTRYATFGDLEKHCKRTGSVLSLLCTQVLGYQNDSTLKYAEQLGIALQLTFILRELHRDILQGRIYFPQDELERFGVNEQSLLDVQLTEAVQVLLAYQTTRIRAYYQEAFKYLAKEDRFNQRNGLIRAQLALATLQEIENDGYQLFKHRIHLTPLHKLWITWRTSWGARRWQFG
ncbi:squalene/phytoene synthase family protein [Candidatus Parabeggiatoa sp. HSG14]|uniref:squalene/phytoene synthase family protein n=1 Tax=Candidatus Parabeggiatoa sp. HSG14 TaxID=3055593 RepID=UPI0025A86D1D|nr:squalene/phytoene synthase family protein [Thiotrichales bacterium HSG14]